jgi:hypothetical protein
MKRIVLSWFFACLLLVPGLLADGITSAPGPILEIERQDDRTLVTVASVGADGELRRHLLRETAAVVTPGATGGDPGGRAFFATWAESGATWFATSRDAGATWARSRPLKTDLRLRDGAIAPDATMPGAPAGTTLPEDGRLFLVQFRTVGLPEWRDSLSRIGAEVLSHVPHNGHIVRAEPGLTPAIAALDFVQRVEPYHPWYRLDDRLRRWLEAEGDPAETRRVRAMALGWGAEAKARVIAGAEALGATVAEYWKSGHIVEVWVTRDQLRGLAAHDEVMWIDPWTEKETDMDLVRQDAGTDWIENNFGYCGQGVRGEVMDNGIQADHPDFDGILLHTSHDVQSHGTSTFGIVFGNGDRDGDGQAKGTGHMPCPEAQGIFADYGSVSDRFAHTQELKADPYWASFQTNSWGDARTRSYTSVSHEMDDIIWRLDIAILQSQSNAGNQDSRPQAWAKNIISVGGIRHYDTLSTTDDAWAGGASIGPAADGRLKPDICYWYDDIYTTTTGSGYTSGFGGTSGATPEAAGVLGLMLQMWADNVWQTDPIGSTVFEKQPHFSTLKALLINNANQYEFTGSGHDLSRYKQGWGRPSSRVAHERAIRSFIVDEEEPLLVQDFIVYSVDVDPGEEELKITMVYPDPPGTTSSSLHRINDVNLFVTSPSGTEYHGNVGLVDGTESVPGGSPNDRDTVENVFIRNPESGRWEVEIEALEVNQDAYLETPEDDVTFALVVTGGNGLYTSGLGRVRFTRSEYACGLPATIQVRDGNAGSSTVTVSVWSDTEPDPELVTLTETGPGSGKYRGDALTSTDPPQAGDGIVAVSHGDTLTVEYIDVDDGEGGANLARQDTALTDCLAPVISEVGESGVTDVRATVTWLTDEESTSVVHWGETIPPDQTTSGFGSTTSHSVALTGLRECTVYYYSVASEDSYGNVAEEDNSGVYFHFETLGDFGQGLQPCHEGRLTVEAETVSCSSSLPVSLVDLDLNLDSAVVDTVTVSVTSSTEIVQETLVLTETGPNTSTFTGSIDTAPGPVTEGDGILQTTDGDLLTARYEDSDDGTGNPHASFDTAVADCAASAIPSVWISNVTDHDVTVNWTTSEPTTGIVEWGTTPALGEQASSTTLRTSHSVTIGTVLECERVYFRVVSTDAYGHTSATDADGAPFEFNANTIGGTVFRDDYLSDAGWSLDGEWEIGEPQGLGPSPGDPDLAFTGTRVLGHDLSGQGDYPGEYEPGSQESATSPAIDASALSRVELRFHRWLNVGSTGVAYIQVGFNGGWAPLWNSPSTGGFTDSAWTQQSLDVTEFAAGNPSFRVRFLQTSGFQQSHDAGWNVDRFIVRDADAPMFAACGGCGGAPTFAGVATVADSDPCADTGTTLTWAQAPAWGTGDGGTYSVYRDTVPGFAPGPGNLVASGVTGTAWNDTAAPNGVTLYYVVRAENDETCGTGPANGGLTDANLVYGVATDETSQPPPGEVGATLRVDGVNRAHARLTWAATPDAAAYHVYRAATPDGIYDRVADGPATVHEEQDVFGDSQNWYYLVQAADACGNEEAGF